jgi:hypothetical protein
VVVKYPEKLLHVDMMRCTQPCDGNKSAGDESRRQHGPNIDRIGSRQPVILFCHVVPPCLHREFLRQPARSSAVPSLYFTDIPVRQLIALFDAGNFWRATKNIHAPASV